MITVLNEVSMVVFYLHIMHKYGYDVPFRDILIKPFIASIVMSVVVYYLHLDLFTSVAVGIVVYVVMILALKTFSEDDLEIIKQLLPERIIKMLKI